MRLFNQQRYDADLIRALQIENEALHTRNAELERALARIEAITAPPRLALSPRRVIPAHPTNARIMRAAGYRPLKGRTEYDPVTGLVVQQYWVRDDDNEE